MTTKEAIEYIRERRAVAFTPSSNFYDSIKHFERILRKAIYYYK